MKDFGRLLLAEIDPLRKWCYMHHPTVTDEDLIQEVLYLALKKQDDYDPVYKLNSWLIGIAKHRIQDLYRKKWRVNVELEEDIAICYQHHSHDMKVIWRCINTLTKQEREFINYQLDGLKVRDIAILTGKSNKTGYVKSFGWLSRHHLKNKLLKVGIL